MFWLVVLVAAYILTARVGIAIHAVSGFTALVWPPTGVSLAALLLLGRRMAPGVLLGAFLVDVSIGAPPHVALLIALGNTLEALLGATLFRRATGGRRTVEQLCDVAVLISIAAPIGAAVSATLGVLSLASGGLIPASAFAPTWVTWWLGHVIADLIVAPAVLTWSSASTFRASSARKAEAAALAVSMIVLAVVLFSGAHEDALKPFQHSYVLFPVFTWAALRFGTRGAATASLALAVVAVWGTMYGVGPFAGGTRQENLLSLQVFMASVSATVLILGAAVNDRNRAEQALRAAHDELESTVLCRTAELRKRQLQLAESQRIGGARKLGLGRMRGQDHLVRRALPDLRPLSQEFPATFKAFLDRIHPDDQARVHSVIDDACRSHNPFSFEARMVRPDGTVRFLFSFGNVVADEQGRTVHMFGTGRTSRIASGPMKSVSGWRLSWRSSFDPR